MATDSFTATNNPLASPWQAVTAMGAIESSGGVAFAAIHDTLGAMVYGTSSAQSSQVTIAARVSGFGGPCLYDPATGNGYVLNTDSDGTDLIIIKRVAGAFNADSGVTTFGTVVTDTLEIHFSNGNVVGKVNGVDRITWADATYRAGLKPGVEGENEGDQFDNFTDGAAEASNVYVVGTAQRNRRHSGHFM